MARKNPFKGFTDLISETNRAREDWMTGAGGFGGADDSRQSQSTGWAPVTDIFTRGDDMVVRCDLAGVTREDVEITLSNGILTISGERQVPEDEQEASFYVSERNYGFFRRSMSLPEGIGEQNIEAAFDHGVLEVIITGGARMPSPRSIQIGSSRS